MTTDLWIEFALLPGSFDDAAAEPTLQCQNLALSTKDDGVFDALHILFDSLQDQALAEEFAQMVQADEPWEYWNNASHARGDAASGESARVRVFGPRYNPDEFVEIPATQFVRLVAEWRKFLEDRTPRQVVIKKSL